jgi:LmbE family N-acetylglucosaminyl deacetylase
MKVLHILTVVCSLTLGSATFAKESVVIVPAHPDDLISSLGFCLLAKDKFDIHVVDFTHGERGLGQKAFMDGSCKKIRMAEEEAVCKAAGATLHWLDEIDGEAYASRETCRKLADIIKELKPRAVFAHWPVDIHTDHVMAGATALRAVFLSGLKPEVYFFDEIYQSKCFVPDRYLDISEVFERKYEILRMYKCQYYDGGIEHRQKACDMVNGMRTAILSTGHAESFKALFPPLQGEKSIFDELPQTSRSKHKFQGAREKW